MNNDSAPRIKSVLPIAGLASLSKMHGVTVYVNPHIPAGSMVVSPDLVEVIKEMVPSAQIKKEGEA